MTVNTHYDAVQGNGTSTGDSLPISSTSDYRAMLSLADVDGECIDPGTDTILILCESGDGKRTSVEHHERTELRTLDIIVRNMIAHVKTLLYKSEILEFADPILQCISINI
ncbi:hypothetical protein JCM18750_35260 [Halostagnicola bangensis]